MKLDQNKTQTFAMFKRRHDELREHFTKAYQQLSDEVADRNYQHVGVTVGGMGPDGSFDADYATVNLTVRFRCEMSADGRAVGRISFYERTLSPTEPERYIDSATFDDTGLTNCTADRAKEVYLRNWPLEMTLAVAETVLRSRATEFSATS